VTVKLAAITKC